MHVEYEWNLRQAEMDESDDDLDDKVSVSDASEPLNASSCAYTQQMRSFPSETGFGPRA